MAAPPPLAGQTSPRIISETSSRPGIVTLGTGNENNFGAYLKSEYHRDEENQIPALQSMPKSTQNHHNHHNNHNKIDLTKEGSLESSTSSTSGYLQDIEKSHESELCQLWHDDISRICLLETNSANNLCDNFETTFMHPSNMRYLQWNWWNIDVELIKYYKNEVTFHGPNLYLSGPVYTSPYPLLRPSNFDTIDFEYPLRNIVCRLPENHYNISLMTDIVSEAIQQDINHHIDAQTTRGNRFSRRYSNVMTSDEELEKDISLMNIKMSVSGCFIAKPYNEDVYHSDASFDIHLHCNWNIECLESDYQYNVFILPSHAQNRNKSQEMLVFDGDYHSLNQDKFHGKLRIYPDETHTLTQNENENISTSRARNGRKRSRSQIEDIHHEKDGYTFEDNVSAKRRKLNNNASVMRMNGENDNDNENENEYKHDEKEELEHKNNQCKENKPLQKRFKNKSSNRKSTRNKFVNKKEQRHGRTVSVTVDRKCKQNNVKKHKQQTKTKIDPNAKYRGYFIAIFVPRSTELYPFCTESMNLQPFIRGQIVFYDAIHADEVKPSKENYQWLIENIMKTYKKKGKNLEEFARMKRDVDIYQKQMYQEPNIQTMPRSATGSLVFDEQSPTNEERVVEEGQVVDLASSSVEPQPADSDVNQH